MKDADEANKITEDMARKIQQTAYDKTLLPREDSCTPPYESLAKQLEVENHQIFCAAVFSMKEIARNRKIYRKNILEILNKVLQDPHKTKEQIEYVNLAIKEIKQYK